MSKGPIELYFWPTPNGQKAAIMLEEVGLPYVVKPVNILKGEQFDKAFLAVNPTTRSRPSSIRTGQAASRFPCSNPARS
jgi:hypothetical protein